MITKEQIKSDLDGIKKSLDDIEDLPSLELVYQLIQQIKQVQTPKNKSLMSQLRSVKKINAPKDFTENLDAYLNGEKPF